MVVAPAILIWRSDPVIGTRWVVNPIEETIKVVTFLPTVIWKTPSPSVVVPAVLPAGAFSGTTEAPATGVPAESVIFPETTFVCARAGSERKMESKHATPILASNSFFRMSNRV
jgi:hypothetical protein